VPCSAASARLYKLLNGGRIAEAALQREQENDLGGFTRKIGELLYQDQDEANCSEPITAVA